MPYDFGALLPQTAAKVKFRDEPIRSLEGKKLGRIEDRKVAAGSSVACKLWFVEKGTSTLQRNGRPRDSRAEPNVSPHCRAHCRLWRTRAEPATSCARHPPVESTPAAHIPPFTLQLPAGLPAYPLPLLNSTPQLHRLPLAVLFQQTPFLNSSQSNAAANRAGRRTRSLYVLMTLPSFATQNVEKRCINKYV